jgi:hypothetical protein
MNPLACACIYGLNSHKASRAPPLQAEQLKFSTKAESQQKFGHISLLSCAAASFYT